MSVIDKGLLCLMCWRQVANIGDVEKEGTGGQKVRKSYKGALFFHEKMHHLSISFGKEI